MFLGTILSVTKSHFQPKSISCYFGCLKNNLILYRRTSSLQIIEEKPLPNVVLRKVSNETASTERPLVILMSWLHAPPGAVKKYCQLYHDRGLDVLVVGHNKNNFLWPPDGLKMVCGVLEYLFNERHGKEQFFVHAFSIGTYSYTVMMMTSMERPEYREFRSRVVGQIFDSIFVGTNNSIFGWGATASHRNKFVSSSVVFMLHNYLKLSKKHTTDRYDEVIHFFINNPIQVPSLMFYSLNDKICDVDLVNKTLNFWGQNFPDFDVGVKFWDVSEHVAHYRVHEEEYEQAWCAYMSKLKL